VAAALVVGSAMIDHRGALARRLADGAAHEEAALAREVGLEAAELLRSLRSLGAWGLDVAGLPGRAYRLAEPVELLDPAAIDAALGPGRRSTRDALEVLDEVDSTNARVLAAPAPPPGRWRACLAEYQSAGRGRRGRAWTQPFGSGLCLSLGWTFVESPPGLAALSLAAGVGVLRALDASAVTGLALKWPNDVLRNGGKLGGILCELRAGPAGAVHVVIGIGLNVRLGADARAGILEAGGIEAEDLSDVVPPVGRSRLAARLIDALVGMAEEFAVRGFAPFAEQWRAADALRDRTVRVHGPAAEQEGVARGIDADGALCVEIRGQLQRLTAGDVTLRAVA
jgi:BirA family transcriptional regulator, biotin operon repressor / biotin---[acetyl-CoA-carboxylase] ligase